MSKAILYACVVASLITGCKKKPEPAPALKAAPPVASAPKTPEEALREVNNVVLAYAMTSGKKLPPTLEDLVKQGVIRQLPPLPPGRKFVMDPKNGRVEIK